MSMFGRREPPSHERTPEERERARLEREARRRGEAPPAFEETEVPHKDVVDELEGEGVFGPREETSDAPPEPTAPERSDEVAADEVPLPRAEVGADEAPLPRAEVVADEVPPQRAEVLAEEPPPRDEVVSAEAPAAETPTVEWDSLAGGPREVRAEPEVDQPAFADWSVEEPRVRRLEPAVSQVAAAQPAPARASARFGDEEDRPVPVRRVARRRTLPPPPPAPGDPVARRRRGRRGRGLGLLALLLLAGIAYLLVSLFQPFGGDGEGTLTVRIPPGSTSADVGDELAEQGVVGSSFLFTVRARLSGADVQAGTYTLKRDMTYSAALDALDGGPAAPKVVRVTIPEGRSRREAQPLVAQAGIKGSYLQASERAKGFRPAKYGAPRDVPSLEGFLFPATYELKPGAPASKLVADQLAAFRDTIAQVDMGRARKRNLTTYDVLIIASMIEREAQLAKERPIIAAVIYNRLREGMPLGIDATIRYATRNWSEPLRQSELTIDSPYNTRKRTGLPPTPIGSPGLDSIRAAANPANVDYLFYVVKPGTCGEHAFSSTDAQFQRDVAAYNRKREAAGGKSPTTC